MAKKTQKEKIEESMEPIGENRGEFPEGWDPNEWDFASSQIWRPSPGDARMGTYDGSTLLPDEYKRDDMDGGDVLIHYLVEHTGQRVSFIGGKMVDQYIAQAGIAAGDRIFVSFEGQRETASGRRVNDYTIRYKKV